MVFLFVLFLQCRQGFAVLYCGFGVVFVILNLAECMQRMYLSQQGKEKLWMFLWMKYRRNRRTTRNPCF